MPFRSAAQYRYFQSKKPELVEEWSKGTDFSKLPERVSLVPKGHKDAFERHLKKLEKGK